MSKVKITVGTSMRGWKLWQESNFSILFGKLYFKRHRCLKYNYPKANCTFKNAWNSLPKYIDRTIYNYSANNVAFDLGIKRKFLIKDYLLWISLFGLNVGPSTKFIDDETPLPASFGASVSLSWPSFLYKNIIL